jgi:hypothetical protein
MQYPLKESLEGIGKLSHIDYFHSIQRYESTPYELMKDAFSRLVFLKQVLTDVFEDTKIHAKPCTGSEYNETKIVESL